MFIPRVSSLIIHMRLGFVYHITNWALWLKSLIVQEGWGCNEESFYIIVLLYLFTYTDISDKYAINCEK